MTTHQYEVELTYGMTETHTVEATSATEAIEVAKQRSPEGRNPDRYPVLDVSAVRKRS